MGPERKHERLLEARRNDQRVRGAYADLTTHLSVHFSQLDNPTPGFLKTRIESPGLIKARHTLKEALQDYGFNRFDARDLSNFVGKDRDLSR